VILVLVMSIQTYYPVSVRKRVLFCFDGKIYMVQWIILAFFKQNITVY